MSIKKESEVTSEPHSQTQETVQDKETKKRMKKWGALKMASTWVSFTILVSAIPILLFAVMGFITLPDKFLTEIVGIFKSGVFLFIGVSCAGASYIDYIYANSFNKLSPIQHKFINFGFWSIVLVVSVIYTTQHSVAVLCGTNVVNPTAFNWVNLSLILSSIVFSCLSKTVIIITNENN